MSDFHFLDTPEGVWYSKTKKIIHMIVKGAFLCCRS